MISLASPLTGVVAGIGDPTSTRTVYGVVILLILIGLVLIGLGVWLVLQTRVDPDLLGPLERMDQRDWRKVDPVVQRRLLDDHQRQQAEAHGEALQHHLPLAHPDGAERDALALHRASERRDQELPGEHRDDGPGGQHARHPVERQDDDGGPQHQQLVDERVGDAQSSMAVGRAIGPAIGAALVTGVSYDVAGTFAVVGLVVTGLVVLSVQVYRRGRVAPAAAGG